MTYQAYYQNYDPEADKQFADKTMSQTPGITMFLQLIAPPAALGLAGFAGSTWITSSYIANWWGNIESPTVFFPFVCRFYSVGLWRKTPTPFVFCLLTYEKGRYFRRTRTVHRGIVRIQSKGHFGNCNQHYVGFVLDQYWYTVCLRGTYLLHLRSVVRWNWHLV
jgi:hypothetical protein